ncbi:transposable element Tcb2 transposase [Trichonephila clavipes]|nr:transposable element Tcb2 transposase [Trichonephila clavipes]
MGRIIGMMEAGWSARRVARLLGRSDCVVKKYGTSGSKRCHLHEDQAQDALDRPVIEKTATLNWTTAEWNQVDFSEESRFDLSSDGNRIRVWRPRGERFNPALALQRTHHSTSDVMVWGAIAYNTRSLLVLIRGTMTAQRYVHDILQPDVLPLLQWLPGAIFQQDIDEPHTARVSQDYLHTVTTLSWPFRSADLSPLEDIWDHLRPLVVFPTSLNKLEARLQKIWNEVSQDIIQNLYATLKIM